MAVRQNNVNTIISSGIPLQLHQHENTDGGLCRQTRKGAKQGFCNACIPSWQRRARKDSFKNHIKDLEWLAHTDRQGINLLLHSSLQIHSWKPAWFLHSELGGQISGFSTHSSISVEENNHRRFITNTQIEKSDRNYIIFLLYCNEVCFSCQGDESRHTSTPWCGKVSCCFHQSTSCFLHT